MCIGPLAPKAPKAPPPPAAPLPPPPIPQSVVPKDRTDSRRRATLAGGRNQNRTLLSGALSTDGQGATLLGG